MWISILFVDKWIKMWINTELIYRFFFLQVFLDEYRQAQYNKQRCLPKIRSLFGTFVRTNNSRRNDWWLMPYTIKRGCPYA